MSTTKTDITGLELASSLREAHLATLAHQGRGKREVIARRNALAGEFLAFLVAHHGLSESAHKVDALDVALGSVTITQINNRYVYEDEDQAKLTETLDRSKRIAEEDERELLQQLAAKHGYRLIAEDAVVSLTHMVNCEIIDADQRRDASLYADARAVPDRVLVSMFAMTDAMRRIRDAFVRADVIDR